MESNQTSFSQDTLIELHSYLKQLVAPDELALSKHPSFARVEAYWHIGRIIVETEQEGEHRADYGVQLIENLSTELTKAYGSGYKTTNLWWFRQFYVEFPIPHAERGELGYDLRRYLRTELTWTHYRLLVAIDDKKERNYYLHAAADESWSYRTLQKLVRSRYYYQVALGENQLLNVLSQRNAHLTADNHRSRVSQTKQLLLGQQGWAVTNRNTIGLTFDKPKPDIVMINFLLQRFVGIWLIDSSPTVTEFIRSQLEKDNKISPKR